MFTGGPTESTSNHQSNGPNGHTGGVTDTSTAGGGIFVTGTSGPVVTPDYSSGSWRHTVILVERRTSPGQDLFIRGGIDHKHMTGM